ncbi:Nuclear receptor coactivator 7 [Bienertia sinuspersici]
MHVASFLLERFGSVIYYDRNLNTEGPQKVIRARTRIPLKGALIPGCYLELEPGKVNWVDFWLKRTVGSKSTSVNLMLSTHAFRPENTSDCSESDDEEEEGKDDDMEDSDPRDSKGDEDDYGNGDPGPSKKRPTNSSLSSSSSSNSYGKHSKKKIRCFHERMVREEVDYLSSRKWGIMEDPDVHGKSAKKQKKAQAEYSKLYLVTNGGCSLDTEKWLLEFSKEKNKCPKEFPCQAPYENHATPPNLKNGGSLTETTASFMRTCKKECWNEGNKDMTMHIKGGKPSVTEDFWGSKDLQSTKGDILSPGKSPFALNSLKLLGTFVPFVLLLQLFRVKLTLGQKAVRTDEDEFFSASLDLADNFSTRLLVDMEAMLSDRSKTMLENSMEGMEKKLKKKRMDEFLNLISVKKQKKMEDKGPSMMEGKDGTTQFTIKIDLEELFVSSKSELKARSLSHDEGTAGPKQPPIA